MLKRCISPTLLLSMVIASGILFPVGVSAQSKPPKAGVETIKPAAGTESIKPKVKPRIAVLDFDFASVSETALGFSAKGGAVGISNLLTNQLAKTDQFIIIERSRIEAVLAEQNMGDSGRVEASTAAQIGRILGVDAVLVGSVTKFFVEDGSQAVSVGSFFGLGGGQRKQTATVQLAARLVNTATGEILTTAEGTGVSNQKDGAGSVFGIGGGSTSNARDRIIANAAEAAVTQVVTTLNGAAPKIAAQPALAPVIEMVVADVTGGQITLNKGAIAGLRPGMMVSVERVIKEIKDPTTGKRLRTQSQPIGKIQIVEVDSQSAVGKVMNGTGFRVGDRAKAIQ
jgi:curli biogenesis system outer membrane secretion channel CsgG